MFRVGENKHETKMLQEDFQGRHNSSCLCYLLHICTIFQFQVESDVLCQIAFLRQQSVGFLLLLLF